MNEQKIRELLVQVQSGQLSAEAAAQQLAGVADLGYAQVDLDRRRRCGHPEVIYCEGKTAEWVEGVARRLIAEGQDCLATRVNQEQAEHLKRSFPEAEQDRLARTFWQPIAGKSRETRGKVVVATAGTSDLPVAQEALVTARVLGAEVEMIVDAGVAGIHRILRQRDRLSRADARPAWTAPCPASSADWSIVRSSPCRPASATGLPSTASLPY
jgi:NCAIR mutase (PurE)-related protein